MITLPQGEVDPGDVTAITQVILLERESRDVGRWDRMRECFHPDSLVRVSWFSGSGADFVNGSIDMARRGMLAKHRLGPILVRIAGDRAVATLGGIIDIPTTIDGIEAQLSSHTRMYFRLQKRDGAWKISGFDAVYLRDELIPSVPGESLHIQASDLKAFRKPYRLLAYVQTRLGYTVNMNLAGEDRPESVAALESELFGWAGIRP